MSDSAKLYGSVYPLLDPARVDRAAYLRDLTQTCAIMVPQPMQHELIRIGGDGDGGYLIPDDLRGLAACFSPGVDNRKDFEDELAVKFGIRSHMCDYTSDESKLKTPLIPGMQTFRKCWLDIADTPDSISLPRWVEELSRPQDDLMLQIDIEGAEFRNLIACDDATLARFRVICIEIHALFQLADPSKFYGVFKPFFDKLAKSHVTVHAHPNNYNHDIVLPGTAINMPNTIELTLLRRDRLASGASAKLIAPQLPHPLDVVNAKHLEPIVFSDFWHGGRTPGLESRLRRLADDLDFVRGKHEREVKQAYQAVQSLAELVARLDENRIGEVSPAPAAGFAGLVEVAAGKPFRLGASLEPLPADPRVPASSDAPYFFHTAFEANAFIEVDLGEVRRVRAVAIDNRPGAKVSDRAYPLFLTLSAERGAEHERVAPMRITEAFVYAAAPLIKSLSEPVEARYVRIGSPVPAYLHFRGLRIYAEP